MYRLYDVTFKLMTSALLLWLLLQKLKQVLESIYYSTVSLRIGEMNRHHAVPPPRPHLHQQPQFQQPLDVIAGVMTDREQPIGDGELPIDGDSQQQRWRSLMRHWPVIVYVIFAVSLLLNATVVGVVWSQWRADCSTAQSRCPPHYVSWCTVILTNVWPLKYSQDNGFCRAQLCWSATLLQAACPSVCPSITRW